MHDFRTYIFAKANNPPQRGLSAIAELLVTFRPRNEFEATAWLHPWLQTHFWCI